jgi:hypothetical protein
LPGTMSQTILLLDTETMVFPRTASHLFPSRVYGPPSSS